jgi:hypothetical protein
MSILQAPRKTKHYDPLVERHTVCTLFEAFLELIVFEQDKGDSNVAEAMRHEFGESVTASIMQAAGIKRLRLKHAAETSTQEFTGAQG